MVQWGPLCPPPCTVGVQPEQGSVLRRCHPPLPPSSPSPPPPPSSVGTVTEGLVGLQLGGRKERKANQRREDDPVFPRSAPLAPGTTGCPGTTLSPSRDCWVSVCPSPPAAWPHLDPLPPTSLRCHLGHPRSLVHHAPPGWQPAGTPGPPPPPASVHITPTPVTSGARSQLGGWGDLCALCLNLTLPCWLLWGGPSPPGTALIAQKRGQPLSITGGGFKPPFAHGEVLAWAKGGDFAPLIHPPAGGEGRALVSPLSLRAGHPLALLSGHPTTTPLKTIRSQEPREGEEK